MEEKREIKYFQMLYQHIQAKNKKIKRVEQHENAEQSDEPSETLKSMTNPDSVNKTVCPQIIRQGLSTFGQGVDGSYSFLSCDLTGQGLETLSGLQTFPKLENLSCSHNQLKDISDIHRLKNLFFLNLSHNQISSVFSTKLSSRLVTLDLSHNLLKTLPNLSPLRSLKIFRASHNCLGSLGPITHDHLEQLVLSHNRISAINGALDLPLLESLDLSFNDLFDISALSTLRNLQTLRLNRNQISSLRALQSLETLIELEMACNAVSSLDEVALLSGLPLLSALDLSMNFCQSLKFYRFQIVFMLPALTVLDGQPVDPKEQVKADCFFDQFIELEKSIFLEELPQEKFIDKRVFMYNLIMKTHMSPRIDLSLKNIFGSSDSLLAPVTERTAFN